MSTPPLASEEIIEFLEDLRATGWEVGVDQYVAALNAVVAFYAQPGPVSHESLVAWVAPIVCGNAEEQDVFYARFQPWWNQRVLRSSAQAVASAAVSLPVAKPVVGLPRLSPRLVAGLAAAAVVILVLVAWQPWAPAERSTPPLSPTDPGPTGDDPPPPAPPGPRNTPAPTAVDTPSLVPAWLRLTTPLVPIIFFTLWYTRHRRGPATLRKWQTRESVNELEVQVSATSMFSPEFRHVAQKLRRHRKTPVRELATVPTVEATIQSGGWFTPVYAVRHTIPEYVVLIDTASPRDQQTRFHNEIIDRVASDGVIIERYHFAIAPRVCWRVGETSAHYTLSELVSRHADHAVIIFSDGSGFIDPLTNLPHPWVDTLLAWEPRAIMTPVAPTQWGYRESTLSAAGFHVCPATPSGIAMLAEVVQKGPSFQNEFVDAAAQTPELLKERPIRWLDQHEPDPVVASQLCHDLRSALGEPGYMWLASCAVYPVLQWDLTIYLGQRLCSHGTFDLTLPAIVRLPWFRHGSMPDWLRLRLLRDLPPKHEQQIRQLLRELLLTSLVPAGASFILRISTRPSWVARWRFNALVGSLLRRQPDDSALKDHVFLSFLEARTPRPLSLTLPDVLRQVFMTKGHASLGLRPTTMLVIAIAVSVAALPPPATTGRALQAFRDANELYKGQRWGAAAEKYEQLLAMCRGREANCTDPALTPAYFYLANSYDNLWKPTRIGEEENDAYLTKAVENYTKAAEFSDNPLIRRRAAEYLVAAYATDKLNDPAQAESILRKMIELEPSDPVAYIQLSKNYEDAGRYEEAEVAMLRARDVKPNDPVVWNSVAAYYNRQGEFEKTMEALGKAAELDPTNPQGYHLIGSYYQEKASRDFRLTPAQKAENIQKGLEAENKALKLNPNYIEALVYKNILLRQQALLEKDPERQKALIREADQLRNRAMELQKNASPRSGQN